jgi:hypothetical protein
MVRPRIARYALAEDKLRRTIHVLQDAHCCSPDPYDRRAAMMFSNRHIRHTAQLRQNKFAQIRHA